MGTLSWSSNLKLIAVQECSEPCHSSPTWGAINYFLFSLQNMFPICSTSAPHVSLKIGSVPQKTLFPIYTGHIVPQIASLPMNFTQCDVKNQWNSIESKFKGINGKVFLISWIYQDSIAECLSSNWFTLKPYLIISFCGHHAFLFSTISDTSMVQSSYT